jgi:hypothetical protein
MLIFAVDAGKVMCYFFQNVVKILICLKFATFITTNFNWAILSSGNRHQTCSTTIINVRIFAIS